MTYDYIIPDFGTNFLTAYFSSVLFLSQLSNRAKNTRLTPLYVVCADTRANRRPVLYGYGEDTR